MENLIRATAVAVFLLVACGPGRMVSHAEVFRSENLNELKKEDDCGEVKVLLADFVQKMSPWFETWVATGEDAKRWLEIYNTDNPDPKEGKYVLVGMRKVLLGDGGDFGLAIADENQCMVGAWTIPTEMFGKFGVD